MKVAPVENLDASSLELRGSDLDTRCEAEVVDRHAEDTHGRGLENTFASGDCMVQAFPEERPYTDR